MKTPDAQIRERLFQNVAGQFQLAVRGIVESRKPAATKIEALNEMIKVAYQAGLDRGYDMAYHVYGDEPE